MKVGAKRRRTQEKMKAERDVYRNAAQGNEAADLILKDLIDKGELDQLDDGSVIVSKKKARGRPPKDKSPSRERDQINLLKDGTM